MGNNVALTMQQWRDLANGVRALDWCRREVQGDDTRVSIKVEEANAILSAMDSNIVECFLDADSSVNRLLSGRPTGVIHMDGPNGRSPDTSLCNGVKSGECDICNRPDRKR